ncbi:MAG: permease [Treponema sp.]|nr:permease [Treponema sp.]
MNYKNFKSVTYLVAGWADHITEEELKIDLDFFKKYAPLDKVYLETYRDVFCRKEQILMIKRVLEENGIEVSGGITTVTPDLSDEDKKRQRLFNTFCYCNEPMRKRLKEISEYTASLFDEFIIDDFFFTQCMCEDCQKEKGNLSWSEFRLKKMKEVSENLILKPAKAVNPKCRVIIKYPNWRESYHETGYNPKDQRFMFDGIYTGTETRHGSQQDQHLPRYLSYSLVRYMENVLPEKNGGGWFDPFECDRVDTYLEQAYLTAFSKAKEIMMFCWPSLAGNKRLTPLGFQMEKIDRLMSECGEPWGVPVYIPFNSQGEDHLEDFLGMIGIPFEPISELDIEKLPENLPLFLTESSLYDFEIVQKIEKMLLLGRKVIVSSGFMKGALKKYPEINKFTSISYSDRRLEADEFQVTVSGLYGRNYVKSSYPISFPLLEHRNNATWTNLNAGHGEYHEGIVMYDTYGKGCFEVINFPDMPSRIRDLPDSVLTQIRSEFQDEIVIDGTSGVSLFAYKNGSFGFYCYTNDGCSPVDFNIRVKGEVQSLKVISDTDKPSKWQPQEIKALYIQNKYPPFMKKEDKESVFHLRMIPGDWIFLKK